MRQADEFQNWYLGFSSICRLRLKQATNRLSTKQNKRMAAMTGVDPTNPSINSSMMFASFEFVEPSPTIHKEESQASPRQTSPLSTAKLGSVIQNVWDATAWLRTNAVYGMSEVIFDGNKSWKQMRYATVVKQLREILTLEQKEETLAHLETIRADAKLKDFATNLEKALESLFKDSESCKQKDCYNEFRKLLDSSLLALEDAKTKFSFPNDMEDSKEDTLQQSFAAVSKTLQRLTFAKVTSIKMIPFFQDLVFYMSSKGFEKMGDEKDKAELKSLIDEPNKELQLLRRFKLLWSGVQAAPASEKSRTIDQAYAKTQTVCNGYSPWDLTNVPSHLATIQYENGGKIFQHNYFRCGVPIKPSGGGLGSSSVWEIQDPDYKGQSVRIHPEFLAMLDHLKSKGKVLLSILHLNPTLYESSSNSIGKGGLFARKIMPTTDTREALWIQLMMKLALSDQYQNVLKIALLPLDGEWLENLINRTAVSKSIKGLINLLIILSLKKDSPFIFPGVKDKKDFVEKICQKVEKEYFTFPGKIPYPFTDHEKLLAFYAFFCSKASEALEFINNATLVSHNCKEGVDRTMAVFGCELIERISRIKRSEQMPIGSLGDPEIQNQLITTVLGPALGNLKRELLESRLPIIEAAMQHMDWMQKNKIVNATSKFDGNEVVKVKIGGHVVQDLFPNPSTAKTAEDYLEFLALDIKNLSSLSRWIGIKGFATTVEKNGNALTQKTIFIDGFEVSKEFAQALQILAMDEKLLFEKPMQMVTDRYNHEALGYKIHFSEDQPVCKLASEPPKSTLTLEKPFSIKDGEDSIKAAAKMIIKVNLKKKTAKYHWIWEKDSKI